MFTCPKWWILGRQDGSVRVLAAKSDGLSSVSGIHMMGGEN